MPEEIVQQKQSYRLAGGLMRKLTSKEYLILELPRVKFRWQEQALYAIADMIDAGLITATIEEASGKTILKQERAS